jgi:sn-glycerol 3-phosphate transport system substrate-binding protein
MKRRTLLTGTAALAAAPLTRPAFAQAAKVKIVFWHSMTAALGEAVNQIVAGFNASQQAAEVTAIYKGSYPETLTAAIAAFRAGQAPHLVQMFEIGTGSMLAAGPAVKQTWQLIKETGVAIDPARYVPAIRGYYSLPDGRLASMPFNSSTAVMWYNKDAFDKAGLDPEKPPVTWQQMVEACRALKAKAAAPIPMTTSWPTWIQLEQYSAIHNLPYATKANGFEGLDTQLKINGPGQVKHIQRLLDMAKEGTFKYGGRNNSADALFPSGEAAIGFNSSGVRGDVARTAKFRWGEALLPYDPEVNPKPINSVIGGASLWTMTAPKRSPEEYKAVAEFLRFIALPENDARWHQSTGYVPVTFAGYELSKQQGFYDKNPGADLPIQQLARGQVTANSRGFRLGRMPELRNIIEEELEKALQGQQNAKQALDAAVVRGDKVLREFQKSVKA